MKRILALLVAMVMTLGCVGITAMAEETASVVAKIGTTEYTDFAAAMADANAMTGDVTVEIYGAVEFTNGMELNGSYTSIAFVGKTDDATMTINQSAGGDYLEAHGKTVAFTDLTLAKANPAWAGNSGHMGNYFSVQGGTVTYTNCTFPNGACTSGGTATYNDCTFQNSSEYGLWVYDDALVTVNGGTIDSTKGIKVYSEDETSVTSTLTVQNATFTENVTAKPAVAIGYAESITLIGNTYNNTTGVLELDSGSDADCEGVTFVAQDANGNDIASTLTAVDRSNSSAACGVLVDGKIYTTVANAAAAATEGSTVTLLHDSTEIVELPEGVTLDTNSYTAENVTVKVSAPVEVATYAELVAALAQGGNIILTADIITTAALTTSGITATIDLNGKTLNVRAGDNKFNAASNITIKNGTINIDGVDVVNGNAIFCLDEYEKTLATTVTLNNVNVEGTDYSSAYGIFYIGASSVLNVNGGTWTLSNDKFSAGGVFKADSAAATLNISDATMDLHNVRRVVTYADTTIENSTLTIYGDDDGVDAEMEHGFNRSPLAVVNSTITMTDMVGRGITAEFGAVSISEGSTVTIENVQEATIDVRAGQTVTVSANSTVSVDAEPTISSGKIDGTVVKVTTGLTGTGTEEDPYLINNLNELIWFRDTVNTYQSDGSNQFKGKYVKLNADIDLAGENWEPIGNNSNNDHKSFMGIFDGGGHTIKNLYVNSNGDHLGFFARIGSYAEGINPTVKNIIFENVDVSSNTLNGHGGSYVGGVIANAGGNSIVENVKVKGDIYVTGYGYVGGIVGHGYPDLTDCSVIGNDGSWVQAHYWCAGGIIGYAGEGGTPITNCSVSGLDIWSAYGAAAAVAGLLQDGNTVTNVSAENVEITSNSDYCMGYIAGNGECSTMTEVTVTNVTATAKGATITATDAVAEVNGSIYFNLQEALNAAAAGTGNVTVEILTDIDLTNVDWNPVTVSDPGYPVVTVNGNNKTIKGLNDMLFAGTWAGNSGLIINDLTIADSNIVNDKDDTEGTVGVGAFIGYPQASETITLNNCHLVNSTVEGGHWTGGLIGMAGGYNGSDGPVFMNLTITDCSVTGSTITGKGSAGGVIGHGSCAAWTNVVIENTIVSGNTITSTGSSTNKAGAVMGTIGAAGQSTTANGETKTGGASVAATVSDNTVTSNGTTITTIYGRQGTTTGMLYVTGGTYDNNPIEENVAYAQPAEGYEIVQNEDGTYGVQEKSEESAALNTKVFFLYNRTPMEAPAAIQEKYGEGNYYRVRLYAAIDGLDYSELGFKVAIDNEVNTPASAVFALENKVVYDTIKVTTVDGTTTLEPEQFNHTEDFNAKYLYALNVWVHENWGPETKLSVTPYAKDLNLKEFNGLVWGSDVIGTVQE